MENQQNEPSSTIKQEYLVYGIAAAVVIIVVLLGSLLYVLAGQNNPTPQQGGEAPAQLPPGHPPVQPGQSAGPLSPEQMESAGATNGASTSPSSEAPNANPPGSGEVPKQ